jgi:hypothetical protein
MPKQCPDQESGVKRRAMNAAKNGFQQSSTPHLECVNIDAINT